jgi:hypothetical protein
MYKWILKPERVFSPDVDREFSDRMLRYEVKIILKDSRPKRDEQKSEQAV